jgi:hypothetical protein
MQKLIWIKLRVLKSKSSKMIKAVIISLFIIFFISSFTSCDAFLMMSYQVKNKTSKSIQVKILNYNSPNYCSLRYLPPKDTIIELKPGKSIVVGCNSKIDFPWGTKNIYRNQKGVTSFDLIQNDTIVKIDKSDKHWKYHHKSSTFSIKRAMLK